jgi:hypothetical protein
MGSGDLFAQAGLEPRYLEPRRSDEISAFQIARITGMSHPAQLKVVLYPSAEKRGR